MKIWERWGASIIMFGLIGALGFFAWTQRLQPKPKPKPVGIKGLLDLAHQTRKELQP